MREPSSWAAIDGVVMERSSIVLDDPQRVGDESAVEIASYSTVRSREYIYLKDVASNSNLASTLVLPYAIVHAAGMEYHKLHQLSHALDSIGVSISDNGWTADIT